MVAQNLGAKRWDRITAVTWSGIGLNLLLTGTPAVIIVIFCRTILGWILPGGATSEAADIGLHINGIVIWSYVLFGITIVLFGVVRSTGAVMAPLGVLFIALWGIRIPFAKILAPKWGADAIWWSFPLGSVIAAALAALYYWHGSWKRAHMITATPDATEAEIALANIEG
jgi:Na+-driven multidrug efflux pump